MKKILKLFSVFVLLISSFTFAQHDPRGCIPLEPPFDKLIKQPITNDMFGDPNAKIRSQDISQNLANFQESLYKHTAGETVPTSIIEIVEHSTETAYYEIPKSMVDKSSSIQDLRNNIRIALKSERDVSMIEFYVGWEYQLQILENSGLNYQTGRFGSGCLSGILGGLAIGAGVGGGVGTLVPAIGTAAGAVVGGLIGGTIGAIKNCR